MSSNVFDLKDIFNELDKDSNGFLSDVEVFEDVLLYGNFI